MARDTVLTAPPPKLRYMAELTMRSSFCVTAMSRSTASVNTPRFCWSDEASRLISTIDSDSAGNSLFRRMRRSTASSATAAAVAATAAPMRPAFRLTVVSAAPPSSGRLGSGSSQPFSACTRSTMRA